MANFSDSINPRPSDTMMATMAAFQGARQLRELRKQEAMQRQIQQAQMAMQMAQEKRLQDAHNLAMAKEERLARAEDFEKQLKLHKLKLDAKEKQRKIAADAEKSKFDLQMRLMDLQDKNDEMEMKSRESRLDFLDRRKAKLKDNIASRKQELTNRELDLRKSLLPDHKEIRLQEGLKMAKIKAEGITPSEYQEIKAKVSQGIDAYGGIFGSDQGQYDSDKRLVDYIEGSSAPPMPVGFNVDDLSITIE